MRPTRHQINKRRLYACNYIQSFNELVEMASRGDHKKVNYLVNDLSNSLRTEEDWYNAMSQDIVIFSLAKLADEAYDGEQKLNI